VWFSQSRKEIENKEMNECSFWPQINLSSVYLDMCRMRQPLEQRLQELLVGVKSTPFPMASTPFQVNEFLQIVMITTTMTCCRKRRMRKLLEQKLRRPKTRDSPSSLNSTLDQLSFSSRYTKQSENLHTFGNTFLLYSSQASSLTQVFNNNNMIKTYSG
jgi:hypothetical protein